MSGNISEEVLSIATLGRPFHLGMLYDCRTDKILPGITLWDNSTLENKHVQQLGTADFEIIASDTIDDKASALDVKASLKLSFLGGLLEVSGSAKYLDNRKSSNHQERVTLKYKCTTRSEEMTMEQLGLGKIEHPQVFEHGTATHVVTGITYGGHAFFVFEREQSCDSKDKVIYGHLHAMVDSIPGIKINGEGELDISENQKKDIKQFSCRYIGDFVPSENPSSFEDAVRIYKEIPKFLGKNGENAVPINAHLYPLILLDNKACRLVREISTHIVRETEKTLEDLYELDVKCNDLIKTSAVQQFRGIKEEIEKFKSLLITYKLGFQRELSSILPQIRGGGKEEGVLATLLQRKESSPFGCHALASWIQSKERQVRILSEYTSTLSMAKFASKPGDLESVVMSPNYSQVLCFTILMPVSNPHLSQMAQYIRKEECANDIDVTDEKGIPLKSAADERTMMEKARHYRDFAQANQGRTDTAFIVVEERSDSHEFQANIKYYKNGHLAHEDFEIPTAPGEPITGKEEFTHSSISVTWDAPAHGVSNIKQYKISCEKLIESSDPITLLTDSATNTLSITDLEPGFEYCVSVQCCCEAGVSLSGKRSKAMRTKPTSPPGKPEVWQISTTTVGIKFSEPLIIGTQWSIKKYVIKKLEEGSTDWSESSSTPEDRNAVLKVKPNVAYCFKVHSDCGPAGYSLDSEVSKFVNKVSLRKLLHERLCMNSTLLQSEIPRIYQPKLYRVAFDNSIKIQKFEVGSETRTMPEKIIMIVGATGSGKTTLINGIVNYIFDINWKDDFRIKLITEPGNQNQGKSQTRYISSYTIHHQEGFKVPYTLTIIDTPGFGDVEGIEKDKEITQQIRSFFTTRGVGGIDRLDAVGFTAESYHPRLTPTLRYIFDQILSLFGKDIAKNIFMLLTFADGNKPQVLSRMKEADMPYKKFFKFNNSALYANNEFKENTDEESDDDEYGLGNFGAMFWMMGEKSFRIFLEELNVAESMSLTLTKDVLNERNRLEVSVTDIQLNIQLGLNKLERYQEATEKKRSAETLVKRVKEEFQAVQLKVLLMTETVRKSLERLKEIALKPNPLSTVEYIDILIDSEKAQANPGWHVRVEQLRKVRTEAEYMKKVADQGFDPFEEYKKKILELEKTGLKLGNM